MGTPQTAMPMPNQSPLEPEAKFLEMTDTRWRRAQGYFNLGGTP